MNKDLKLSKKALHSLSAELSEQFIAGVDDLLRLFAIWRAKASRCRTGTYSDVVREEPFPGE